MKVSKKVINFFSCLDEGDDYTKLANGEVAYRLLGVFDNTEEGTVLAQRACGIGISREQDIRMISNYLKTMPLKELEIDETYCDLLAEFVTDKENRPYHKE